MVDAVALLRDGRIVQVGAPRTLCAQPACRFVAGLPGETSFPGATVNGTRDGLVTLDTAGGQLVSAPRRCETARARRGRHLLHSSRGRPHSEVAGRAA